jgi:hypothetical protein
MAAIFILALPSLFEAEPASEVEPIKFGPPPVQKLADATRVPDLAATGGEPVPSVATPPSPSSIPDPALAAGGAPTQNAGAGSLRPTPDVSQSEDGGRGGATRAEDDLAGSDDDGIAEEDEEVASPPGTAAVEDEDDGGGGGDAGNDEDEDD